MTPETFGDVTSEYLALKRGAAAVPDSRAVVWVSGSEAVGFVDGLVSQDVDGMEAGDVARSLLLSPKGKLVAHHWLLRGDAVVGLVTDAGAGEPAAESLRRFKIRVDAEVSIDNGPIIEVWGAGAPGVLLAAGLDPDAGWSRHERGIVAELAFRHGGPPRWVVTGIELDELVTAGATPSGQLARDAVAIERGEPVMGRDVDTGTIPEEADLVDGAVSFTKGCYLGQELVARIDSRGHVNRRGRGIVISDAVLPPPGALVEVDGQEVGQITAVAESLDLRAPVAYGLIRAEVEPGSAVRLEWSGGAADAVVRAFPLEPDLIETSQFSNTT